MHKPQRAQSPHRKASTNYVFSVDSVVDFTCD